MNAETKKYKQMTETPVPKLIMMLAIPSIISMLVTSVYNMADTFFVGQIQGATQVEKDAATGAAAVVFSLMAIIQACGFFFGQGSGNYISRELGNRNVENAEKMATFSFVTSILLGLTIAAFGLIFIEPLAYLLGSTKTILPYAKEYMLYILISAPFMCGSFVLNNQLRFQGNAAIAMIGIISGAVINIGLDALFILVLGMKTDGAGLATAIGQTIGFIILFIGVKKSNNVQIRIKNYRFSFAYLKEVFRGGTPSLARQGLSSIATLCLNFAAKSCGGDAAISAMGIVSRIMMFCFSASLGFGQGFQPVCGYNYGAKRYGRVKEGFFFCIKVATVVSFVLSLIMFIFAPQFVGIFNEGDAVVEIGKSALRLQCVAFQFVPLITFTNMMLQTMGKVVPATLLSMGRQGVFFLPFVFLLPWLFNIQGLIWVQPVADALTFILALILAIFEVRLLNKLAAEQNKITE